MTERDMFEAAMELPLEDRLAYLAGVCGEDAALRQRLEALLSKHDRAASFLEKPAVPALATVDDPLTAHPGTVIGPYKLVEPIGEGGFGVVYLAEQQQPVHRQVALKVIKPGMDSKHVIARFEAERQALAMMDHTNIARVFDAGATASGRPYFVMELVRGVPITGFCDDHRLTLRERLELFVAVCQAVQHAHQKGIIHRDLKPSNVLVTLHDGVPLVKVIDFGIAKALGRQRLTDKTLVTGFAQMIGTPLYMSPEQAEMSGQDADTRTDIYALGVLLYELLTGTTPFDRDRLKEASYDEIRRIIREEEPAKPSARISTLGQAATTVSANRQSGARRLSQLFRGELDWIVMKALEKDRNRRYDTASSLAADVQRYLDDESVQACPPSVVYRLRKFARKNRMPLIVAAAFVLMLLTGALVSAWQAARATNAERVATRKGQEARTAEAKAKEEAARASQQAYTASIRLMQQAWDSHNMLQLHQLLDETAAFPERSFEWYYWQRLGHLELYGLIGHWDRVNSVSWSPDGQRLATGSHDRTVKVWEAESGRELCTLKGHTSAVWCVAWSPDGQRLATGSYDRTAKVWEAASGRELCTLKGHTNAIWSVSWSPDGQRLATGSLDGTAKVWNATRGLELLTLTGHTSQVQSVSWSPNGQRLATGSKDATAKVWDAASGKELRTLKGRSSVWSVSWSPDGQQLATGHWDGTAQVWEAVGGRELFSLAQENPVVSVSWSPDGHRLAVRGADTTTAQVWDLTSGRELMTLKGHTHVVHSLSWSPDGQRLATASSDGTAKVWEVASDREVRTLQGHTSAVHAVSWSPDGQRLATGSEDGTVQVWEVATGREWVVPVFGASTVAWVGSPLGQGLFLAAGAFLPGTTRGVRSLQGSPVHAVAWSPDGQRLATGSTDGTVKVREAASGRALLTLRRHTGPVWAVAWSPDSQRLATASWDGTSKVWEAASGRELLRLEGHLNPVWAVAWSPDGQWLATGSGDGTAQLWEAASGRELLILRGHTDPVRCVAWSPDGQRLATGSRDGTGKVWDATRGRELLTLKGHKCPIRSVSWPRDGQRLATGSEDGTAKVWDAATGRELLTLKGHTSSVHCVSWSLDGQRLATGSEDGTAKVWESATASAVQAWTRQDRAVEQFRALSAYRVPQAQGFLQDWLLLVPLPLTPGESSAEGLLREQLPGEAQLRPRAGQRVRVGGHEWVWQAHRAPQAVLDFNAVLGRETNHSIAYAVCYLDSDRARDKLWLEVGSDDQAKVYLNGEEVYQYSLPRPLAGLDKVGPVTLRPGTNVLVFKVVNENEEWLGCVRLVGADGKPAQGIQVRLTPE